MLTRMARESGIETPTAEDLVRLDRKRTGKKLPNADWESPTDPDAKVARMKNGATRLGCKPEHAVDLDTGVIVAAPIHPADKGDTNTLDPTLKAAARNLAAIGLEPAQENRCDLVTDKGYHSRDGLKALAGGGVEDPHIRALAGKGGLALARRRGCPEGGLRQSRPAQIRGRAQGHAKTRRDGGAQLCARSGSGRHAPRMAARAGKPSQTLSHPRRRVQSRHRHARIVRIRDAEGGCPRLPGVSGDRSETMR